MDHAYVVTYSSLVVSGLLTGFSVILLGLCGYRFYAKYENWVAYTIPIFGCLAVIIVCFPEAGYSTYAIFVFIGAALSTRLISQVYHRKIPNDFVDLAALRKLRQYSLFGATVSLAAIPLIPNLPLFIYERGELLNGQYITITGLGWLLLVLVRDLFRTPSPMVAILAELAAWGFGIVVIELASRLIGTPDMGSANRTYFLSLAAALFILLDRFAIAITDVNPSHYQFAKIYDYPRLFRRHPGHTVGIGIVKGFGAWFLWSVSSILHAFSLFFVTLLIGSIVFYFIIFSMALSRATSANSMQIDSGDLGGLLLSVIVTGGIVVALIALSVVSSITRQVARQILRLRFEDFIKRDSRPPILLLRSFEDDHVTLPDVGLMTRLIRAIPKKQRFDHQLVENFSWFAPIVALGNPKKTSSNPYGAIRRFLDEDDPDWLTKVLDEAYRAKAIVIVVDTTAGVREELKELIETPILLQKTLFFVSPRTGEAGLEQDELLKNILALDINEDDKVIGFFKTRDNDYKYIAKNLQMDDYMICMSGFIANLTRQNAQLVSEL